MKKILTVTALALAFSTACNNQAKADRAAQIEQRLQSEAITRVDVTVHSDDDATISGDVVDVQEKERVKQILRESGIDNIRDNVRIVHWEPQPQGEAYPAIGEPSNQDQSGRGTATNPHQGFGPTGSGENGQPQEKKQ